MAIGTSRGVRPARTSTAAVSAPTPRQTILIAVEVDL
jgi:hypothetical protein